MDIEKYLHPRIISKCILLFNDKYYSQCALESMKQVELALKEKTNIGSNLFGRGLIEHILGNTKSVKLIIPLEENMQKDAKILFEGAFSYYRNYAAHDGNKIDEIICFRIMILSSELLDLIDASKISYSEIGGITGLIKSGVFLSKSRVKELIDLLLNEKCIDDTFDGLFENLSINNFSDDQFQSIFDLGLMVYKNEVIDESMDNSGEFVDLGYFELTEFGKKVLENELL